MGFRALQCRVPIGSVVVAFGLWDAFCVERGAGVVDGFGLEILLPGGTSGNAGPFTEIL